MNAYQDLHKAVGRGPYLCTGQGEGFPTAVYLCTGQWEGVPTPVYLCTRRWEGVPTPVCMCGAPC